MSLPEAIDEIESDGLTVFYSSDLIRPDMIVTEMPVAGDPRERLEAILTPFGLTVRPGPAGALLIGRAQRPAEREPEPLSQQFEEAATLSPPRLEEVVVAASRYELERGGTPAATLRHEDIEHSPDLAGDALRAVARLPGHAGHSFTSRSHVRGGESMETLFRFDGLRLYAPYHLDPFESIFSAIDPRIVGSMTVYTGAFPVIYGDRMSGVVDISSLPAPEHRYHEIAVSLFNASALTTGGFAAGRGKWFASFRRSNLDLLYEAFSSQPVRPRFVDGFARFSYDVNDRLRISANVLHFEDDVWLTDDLDLDVQAFLDDQDRYTWLRFDHYVRDDLTGMTLLSRSRLRSERLGLSTDDDASEGTIEDTRSFDIDSLQTEWSWRINETVAANFGASISVSSGRYDYRRETDYQVLFDYPDAPQAASGTVAVEASPEGEHFAVYGSLRLRPAERVTMDLGLRADQQTLDAMSDGTLSPRAAITYYVARQSAFRAAVGRFYQSQTIDELQVEDGVDYYSPPQRSDHAVLAFEHGFPNELDLRVEVFLKRMRRTRPRYENLLNSLTLLPELQPDRIEVAPLRSEARGIELLVRHRLSSRLAWWASYSRSRVEDELAGGLETVRSWDQPSSLSGGLQWDNQKWNATMGLLYRSGWPTTPVVGALLDGEDTPTILVGPRNSARVGDYRSVDFRLTRTFELASGGLSAFLELSNVFNSANTCCVEYEVEDEEGDAYLELAPVHYLPFVPSIGFVWNFGSQQTE